MIHDKVCEECGTAFRSKTKRAKFCKDECRYAYNNRARENLTAFGDIVMEMPEGKQSLCGRGRRAKGAKGERDVCRLIAGVTGEDVQRNIGQSRDGGHDVDWGPFAIEVKSTQTVSMPAWQEQVRKSVAGTNSVPSVAWRRKGEEFWIALPLQQFVEIFNTLRLAAEASLKGDG